MHDQAMTHDDRPSGRGEGVSFHAPRVRERDLVLQSALSKRAAGAPTFSVPEAAALLSVSREHMYRLVRADAFPVLRVRLGGDQGRYVIPARAVEQLLDAAAGASGRMDIADWMAAAASGGVADASERAIGGGA